MDGRRVERAEMRKAVSCTRVGYLGVETVHPTSTCAEMGTTLNGLSPHNVLQIFS
eukprot:m.94697 g.94697  ORF g.94697 m.94697 type:complete len:55 (+) comp12283_c0_seq2:361-525(+)